jgi:hypothetical protein
MYAPAAYQRRFAFGLQPMLGLIAAVGLERVWYWARRHPRPLLAFGRSCLLVELLVILIVPTMVFYGLIVWGMTHPTDLNGQGGAFQPTSLREAGQWLATVMEPTDVVLGSVTTGNYLGGIVPGRAFVGHQIATFRYGEKEAAVRRFYRDINEDSQRDFLAANGIRYVVYGPHERSLGAASPDQPGYLRLVYEAPEVSVYELVRLDALGVVP